MATSIEALMHANLLDVFGEPDPETRRAVIDRTYAEQVNWTDSEGVVTGRDELERKCAALQVTLGGLRFEAVGPVHELPGFGYLAWRLVAPDGASPMGGFDAAVIRGGVISDLWTVLTPPEG